MFEGQILVPPIVFPDGVQGTHGGGWGVHHRALGLHVGLGVDHEEAATTVASTQ